MIQIKMYLILNGKLNKAERYRILELSYFIFCRKLSKLHVCIKFQHPFHLKSILVKLEENK